MSYDKKPTTIDIKVADLEKKIAEFSSRLARMKECRDQYLNLPFKEGDVAFHPKHGNVIIKRIEYGTEESSFEDIKYVCIDINAQTHKLPYKEVIEITNSTKLLFGKT